MPKKRELKSDADVVCALRHIKEFGFNIDRVIYRYSVANIDKMCYELGLEPVEGQNEATKVFRLIHALKGCCPDPEFNDETRLAKEVDANERARQQRKAQTLPTRTKKGCVGC